MDAERDCYYEAMPREGHVVGRCEMLLPDQLVGKRVLDLGCRRGKGACKIADLVGPDGAVLGVDPSEAYVEAARAYVAEHQMRRARVAGAIDPTFWRAPFEDLRQAGIEDASVDLVFVNSVLNLAWDREAALREIARVLAPGGALHHAGVFAEEPLPAEECPRACRCRQRIRRRPVRSGVRSRRPPGRVCALRVWRCACCRA